MIKMKKELKIYRTNFTGMYPVGSCLIMSAYTLEEAEELASKTIKHTDVFTVEEIIVDKTMVIEYASGDY